MHVVVVSVSLASNVPEAFTTHEIMKTCDSRAKIFYAFDHVIASITSKVTKSFLERQARRLFVIPRMKCDI